MKKKRKKRNRFFFLTLGEKGVAEKRREKKSVEKYKLNVMDINSVRDTYKLIIVRKIIIMGEWKGENVTHISVLVIPMG